MNVPDDFSTLTKEQQTFMINWLKENFTPITTINLQHTAYGLKQKFSRLHFYVTDRQFIEAMLLAGFQIQEDPKNESHCRFNISQKSKFFKI